jgi:putative ABC transport system substrate-binding protein
MMAAKVSRRAVAVALLIVVPSLLRLVWQTNTPLNIWWNASHDDGLFMRLAANISSGRWLGPYDHFTLMKGPGYPLFLALSAASGLPVTAMHAFLAIAAILGAAWAIGRVSGSRVLAISAFLLLIFLPVSFDPGLQALIEGLSEFGWKRDKNVQIDVRWAGDHPGGMQQLAKELIETRPDLIQVSSTPATAAVLRETRTIPVVFLVSDPLGSGFVASFARPGGNATGFVNLEDSIAGKWLELLKELAPQTSRVSILFNPKTAPQSAYYLKLLEAAAPSLAFELQAAQVSNAGEIEAEIAHLAQQSNVGLVLLPDVFTATKKQREMIIALTARHRIPAVYPSAIWVKTGGLVCYGVDHSDLQRRAAAYVDRILKGAKPQDLPVQLPTKFEFVINLKAAKALGLTVPAMLLTTADEVIE